MGEALLGRLAAMPVNVVVKLHDRSRDPRPQYSGGIDWPARLAPLLDEPRVQLAAGANITPYLVAADVMISDHSSAAFEYLLLDRPLVRIDLPELITLASIHQDYVQLLANASHNVSDADAAARAVERALADAHARSAVRRRVAADLFYRPGTAAARCAAALYEVLELPAHPSVAAVLDSPGLGDGQPCLQSA
jgi:CDP-glycerol glycerophosphotransferase (TagB/SpsB family)